ncbi:MAG TPA: N-formylglutamate amidohydrolase, partial [Steroidobacteraceae bacterium]|nr:N-formylglutamate amidohydrolase [Steroidobacteraceae bacterium]
GWSRDARISAPLIKNLRGQPGVTVGDNLPYALEVGADFTTPEHAMARGLAHVQIEFRQDLVAGPDEATRWADLLHDALLAVESKASWHRREYYLEPADNIRGADAWL